MKGAIPTICFVLSAVLAGGSATAQECKEPSWYSQSQVVRSHDAVTVSCKGTGGTQELSELEARNRCDSRVALEYRTRVHVRDIAVTTDKDTASHRKVEEDTCVAGVKCIDPFTWSCESKGASTTWRRCTYELSALREGSAEECRQAKANFRSTTDVLANRSDLRTIEKKIHAVGGAYERTDSYVLNIAVTPKCDDIMVIGSKARRLECRRNPVQMTIQPGDTELIIRSEGYMPKSLELNGVSEDGKVKVFLEYAD